MDKLAHPLARGASWLLIYLTAVQPLHPAIAAGIVAANGNTQVAIKPGNVPVVNIATPNGAGISHNTYQDFNVGAPGAVLNNATQGGKTQLGVTIDNGNAKLNGKPAELIINEVTSGNRSELKGKLEVFGNKAGVMIANPNGITCDGCGFINAPSVTLTTGKPQFDKQGALDAIDVKKGTVIIGGNGLDGTSAEYVDVISRATELNGKINAKTLSLTQGANRVSFKDGTVKPIAGEGAKPQLAVDTKALGGMYAGKIRLVATEDGVGVNLNSVTATQRDISLTTAGKIILSNVKAQTDLNVSGREIVTPAGSSVRAERDMTLAATAVDNRSSTTARGDMRVFASTVRNTGEGAALHSNNNLWIQKDARGNKATLVENRSARIQTNTGDLIIRAETLNNTRDVLTYEWEDVSPDSTQFVKLPQHRTINAIRHVSGNITLADVTYWNAQLGGKWFGSADFNQTALVNSGRKELRRTASSPAASILSGGNSYLNATQLINNESQIRAGRDLIMTGKTLKHISGKTGIMDTWAVYDTSYRPSSTVSSPIPENQLTIADKKNKSYTFQKTGEVLSWRNSALSPATLTAAGNLTADFSERIESYEPYDTRVGYSDVMARPDTITAKNILLHAGSIITTDVMKATGDITLQSDTFTKVALALLTAGKDISILAGANIDSWQSELKGQNITLVSRNGDVNSHTSEQPNYFNADGARWLGSVEATGDLLMTAGGNILLRNTRLPVQSKNITLIANGNITIDKNEAMLSHERPGYVLSAARSQELFNQMLPGDPLRASGDITLSSGKYLILRGIRADAGGNINMTAGVHADMNMRTLSGQFSPYFTDNRIPELRSSLKAGKDIVINAAADIALPGASVIAGNKTTLQAGKNIWLGAYGYGVTDGQNDNNRDELNVLTYLRGARALTLAANGSILADGSTLTSDGNIMLTSGDLMRFQSAQETRYRESGNSWTESVNQIGVTLNAGGALTVISGGSILFQASRLLAKGSMDVAAKGGWLYAQAMEESSHYEKQTTKRKWWGQKTTVKQTKHTTTNRVTEFTAGGNLNLLSRDDSTYEASKIEAGKNATLTSTNGKVNFLAVKNTTFEQTVSTSKGFYIKQADKGYSEGKWVLPSVYAGGKLTVDAANGISADVKTKNGQALQGAITALSVQPGTEWLKGLNTRNDVQWNVVKDAYDSWNYKSQSLNPAVAAVIAIAAAAVTAGTGLAALAGSSAITATGVTGATASAAVYGSAYAGMTSLVSQAAVALVENQGNLSKTLKSLGSSSSVKSLATSMVIGGALAGFDEVMNVSVAPDKARLPALVKDEGWSKVTQRVAGQSVISSSLNTGINGGSFKDNLVNALLSNVGNQIQAEGAGLIGDNGEVLGVAGKSVSHAVLAGISAEIGRGDGKGAAAGALAAELAAISLGDIFVEPATRNNQIQSAGRIIGAITGAAVTNSSGGANSGANAAENVLRYNFLMHDEPARMAKKLADCKGSSGCETGVRKEMAQLSAQNEKQFESCRVSGNGDCINEMLAGISGASGYRELGIQIGFDIAGQYQQMGENAFDRFDTCGWTAGTGCGLKLWGKEALADAALWATGWGAGKYAAPAIGKYLTEVGILSQKGVPAYIKSTQIGLGKPETVDIYKQQMKDGTFLLTPGKGIIAGYTDSKGMYYVSDGNHRMVAAVEFYNETGSSKYIETLIKNGSWTYDANYTGLAKPLPMRK
ncbi:MAG TPA: hemagglutinin [Raoultella sp.]|nr:hemagglutinin [Raoultella sp.]